MDNSISSVVVAKFLAEKATRLEAAKASRVQGLTKALEAAEAAKALKKAELETALEQFEGLEKALELARQRAAGALRISRGTAYGLALVRKHHPERLGLVKARAAIKTAPHAGVYREVLSTEEAAYAAYTLVREARAGLRQAVVAARNAQQKLYRAERAPVVVRVPMFLARAQARRQEQADVSSLAAWHTEKDRLVVAVEGAKAYLVAFTLKHGKKVPAELEEGWWTQADLKVGVPSIWVCSDSQHYAELLPFSVRDVGKYAEAEERVRQLVDTNRVALGTWRFTPKKLAQARTLKSVILRLEAALEAHRQQFPVVQYCYQPPQQPLWRHVETSGSKLVPDTAPADVRLAVAAAKVRHAEEKSPASLRALNAALAKAAQGAPLDAVVAPAPAKPVGRALVDATRIEPVYAALRKDIHSLDSRLGRMLCAFALRGDDKKVVSRVTKAVTLLFGSLPSEVRDATYWGIQKAAAKQAFIALKSGALDATKRGWTERALVENARLFAAVCAARLDGESFAPAQANGMDPLDAIQEYQELATDLEGQFEFEGEEEVELEELDFSEGVCMDAADEDEDEGVDEDDSLDQVVELLAAEGDRQIDSLLGYSAHWDELPEMFAKVKVASTEEAMKKAVSVATEAFESELLRDFL